MWVSGADVESRLRRSLTAEELEDLPGLAEEAQLLVEGHVGRLLADPVPQVAVVVASRMVARVFGAPDAQSGVDSTQLSAGSFQLTQKFTEGSTSGGPWLARADKIMLRALRPSMVSIPLGSERVR